MLRKASKKQPLLDTLVLWETVIIPNGPAVSVYLMRLNAYYDKDGDNESSTSVFKLTDSLCKRSDTFIISDCQLGAYKLLDGDLWLRTFR